MPARTLQQRTMETGKIRRNNAKMRPADQKISDKFYAVFLCISHNFCGPLFAFLPAAILKIQPRPGQRVSLFLPSNYRRVGQGTA